MLYFKLSRKSLWILIFTPLVLFSQNKADKTSNENIRLTRSIADTIDGKYDCSVLIARSNQIIYENLFQATNSKSLLSPKSVFHIASVSKAFTATAILKLQELGALKTTDSIGKFLPSFAPEKRKITIHQLLNHTSGYPQNYVCDDIQLRDSAVHALSNDTLQFDPGKRFGYSNENYEVLAIIVEIASGKSFEDFIREYILKPSAMTNTCFWHETKEFDVAKIPDSTLKLKTKRNWGYIGSAGIFSTAHDLLKYFKTLNSGRIIKKENLQLLYDNHYTTSSGLGIGYGWYIYKKNENRMSEIFSRGNEDWGHNAVIRWFPESETVIIVLTNSGEIQNAQRTGNRIVSDMIIKALY